ncbi:hypothetical protein CMI37_07540 [Candidatus Pacearchaeota archaeon]|jgi:hypothetical protein|nr:hypothetical protein [Candidatus Pacearchaeota archaeon]
MMGWGFIPRRHARKLHPWIVRLRQATAGLEADVRARNRSEVVLSIEDVAFWQGRVICDLLGAEEQPTGLSSAALISAFAKARLALARGRRFLVRST